MVKILYYDLSSWLADVKRDLCLKNNFPPRIFHRGLYTQQLLILFSILNVFSTIMRYNYDLSYVLNILASTHLY